MSIAEIAAAISSCGQGSLDAAEHVGDLADGEHQYTPFIEKYASGARPAHTTIRTVCVGLDVGTSASTTGGSGRVSRLNIIFGVFVTGYGFLFVQQSVLQAGLVVAIGLATFLSGVAGTAWAGDRFDLAAPVQRQLRTGFAVLAILLLAAFFVVY